MKHCTRCCSRKRIALRLGILTGALIAVCGAGLLIGSVGISPADLFRALFSADRSDPVYRILVYVRLPRVLCATLAGGALACAGTLLQSLLANQLASPGIVGVNAGSGLFSLLGVMLFPASVVGASVGAFCGALLAVLAVFALSARRGAARSTVILTGVAVSSLFTALLDTIVVLRPDLQLDRLAFSIGGFSGADMQGFLGAFPFFVVGIVGSMLLSYDFNVLALGDEMAAGVGLRVRRLRFFGLLLAALLAGSAVSIAGLLGFVGLIAPHAVARLIGRDMRVLLPGAFLFGAALTVLCDMVARTAFSPYEIPVGIVLSYIGVPFFLVLLYRGKSRKRGGASDAGV